MSSTARLGFDLVYEALTKTPADSYNFHESQDHKRNHSRVVVHQLKHIDTSLAREEEIR